MTIPDAAVEAMVRAFRERTGVIPNAAWMRDLLEAAAPHMLNLAKREAWDANVEIQRLRAELAKATK